MAASQSASEHELDESREDHPVEASGEGQNDSSKRSKRKKSGKLYCLCRKPAGKRFMIECDKCDEWFHGECVKISKNCGNIIEKYFCPSCSDKDPNLKIIYKAPKEKKIDPTPSLPVRCNECIKCVAQADCGKCARCLSKKGRCMKVECLIEVMNAEKDESESDEKDEEHDRRRSLRTVEKQVVYNEGNEVSATPSPLLASPLSSPPLLSPHLSTPPQLAPRKAGGGGVAVSGKEGKKKNKSRQNKSGKGPKGRKKNKRHDSVSDDGSETNAKWDYTSEKERQIHGPQPEEMQCHGPKCVYAALPNSKYCSSRCGMRLARARIDAHLGKNARDYYNVEPDVLRKKKEADKRREKERAFLDAQKGHLDEWYGLVERYVVAVKQFEPCESAPAKEQNDFMAGCPVCASEYGNKVIRKHMERCYTKKERQNTFGAKQKCIYNPQKIICDEFNPSDDTFCKRLRVTCPEHYKGELEEGMKVCGWPKVWNREESFTMEQLFLSCEDIIADGFCGIPRKECKQHIGWIRTTLGIIDTHRAHYYTRLEEMLDEQINQAKAPDALLLMSNCTEYLKPLTQIIKTYDEASSKYKDKVQPQSYIL